MFNTTDNTTGQNKQIHLPKVYYPHVYLQKSSNVVTLYSRKGDEMKQAAGILMRAKDRREQNEELKEKLDRERQEKLELDEL